MYPSKTPIHAISPAFEDDKQDSIPPLKTYYCPVWEIRVLAKSVIIVFLPSKDSNGYDGIVLSMPFLISFFLLLVVKKVETGSPKSIILSSSL